MCGEQGRPSAVDTYGVGSPPRVRGTEEENKMGNRAVRITPACAGNSRPPTRCSPASRDHPRVCGEQPDHTHGIEQGIGSPPRVRGTARPLAVAVAPIGITPACAGNRRSRRYIRRASWDHPRVCGEQGSQQDGGQTSAGSPPRVRGTAVDLFCEARVVRITPACAGNRRTPFCRMAE